MKSGEIFENPIIKGGQIVWKVVDKILKGSTKVDSNDITRGIEYLRKVKDTIHPGKKLNPSTRQSRDIANAVQKAESAQQRMKDAKLFKKFDSKGNEIPSKKLEVTAKIERDRQLKKIQDKVREIGDINEVVEDELNEREMTDAEKKKREDIVMGMKKNKKDFQTRYGDRWEEVMYATATKMAMESINENYDYDADLPVITELIIESLHNDDNWDENGDVNWDFVASDVWVAFDYEEMGYDAEDFNNIYMDAANRVATRFGTNPPYHSGLTMEGDLAETIRKNGSKWTIFSKKGRKLGTYDTKRAAKKRLRQIEVFKHLNEGLDFEDLLEDLISGKDVLQKIKEHRMVWKRTKKGPKLAWRCTSGLRVNRTVPKPEDCGKALNVAQAQRMKATRKRTGVKQARKRKRTMKTDITSRVVRQLNKRIAPKKPKKRKR